MFSHMNPFFLLSIINVEQRHSDFQPVRWMRLAVLKRKGAPDNELFEGAPCPYHGSGQEKKEHHSSYALFLKFSILISNHLPTLHIIHFPPLDTEIISQQPFDL